MTENEIRLQLRSLRGTATQTAILEAIERFNQVPIDDALGVNAGANRDYYAGAAQNGRDIYEHLRDLIDQGEES